MGGPDDGPCQPIPISMPIPVPCVEGEKGEAEGDVVFTCAECRILEAKAVDGVEKEANEKEEEQQRKEGKVYEEEFRKERQINDRKREKRDLHRKWEGIDRLREEWESECRQQLQQQQEKT